MRRAALQDGWLPNYVPVGAADQGELTPELLAEGVEWIRRERADRGLSMDGYDVVAEGATTPDDAPAVVRPWADAGANWWIEADWSTTEPVAARANAERRLIAGPPRLE